MLRVFIVEDEPPARDELKYLLRRIGDMEIVGEGEDMEESLKEIGHLKPDLIFLDVQLEQGNGLELAEKICSWEHSPLVVFVTAYDEHALRAFELKALDYILKPFDEERIREMLHKLKKVSRLYNNYAADYNLRNLQKNISKTDLINTLAISVGERISLVKIDEILFIGSEERQVFVQTIDQKYFMDMPLYELEHKLRESPFLRVHRGYLINLNYVLEIEPWFNGTLNLIMQGGYKVPVSRSYTKKLKNLLGF